MKERADPIDPDNLKDNQLYSTGAIAELTGFNVETIRNWIDSGKLKGVKVGRHWRVRRRDLLNFLNSKY